MAEVVLHINNNGRFPIERERLFAAVSQRLSDFEGKVQVSLLVVGKEKMAEFNWRYHDALGPTDVLSFPYTDLASLPEEAEGFVTPAEEGVILGDIIVCFEVAEEMAKKENKRVDEVVEFYVLHGLEHLLGNHHE